MLSWNTLFDSVQQDRALEEKKKGYSKTLQDLIRRNCVVYFSCWQQQQGVPGGAFSIDDDDRNGFMNALYGLDKSKGLELVIHSPGGDFAATQSIVGYLLWRCKSNRSSYCYVSRNNDGMCIKRNCDGSAF